MYKLHIHIDDIITAPLIWKKTKHSILSRVQVDLNSKKIL